MKMKRIYSAAIGAVMLGISLFQMPLTVSAADDLIYENLTYTLLSDSAVITGCTGEPETLEIPEEIEGYPVRKIESRAFVGKTALKSVVLPDTLTELGDRAFTNCTALESVTLPDSLTMIMHNTFNGCSALESIVIPDSVSAIAVGAFRNCTKLAEITFPEHLSFIKSTAFADTAWLENQPEGYVYISNALLCYKGELPEDSELVLDESVTVIADNALAEQHNLKSVTFHDQVTAIGEAAFYRTGIVRADIPPVAELGYNTFSECTNLKSVTIPGTVKSIGTNCFNGCTALGDLKIENGVNWIGLHAFMNCDSLESITIPFTVKQILDGAIGYYIPDSPSEDDIIALKKAGDFTIYGYPYTAAETYAEKNGFRFAAAPDAPAPVKGDVNNDGSFRISDAVLFQKWLRGLPDTVLKAWELADWNADGKLNAADLSLMKQNFTEQIAAEPEIQITVRNKDKLNDEIRRYLQDSIKGRCGDLDFSQFTFETHGTLTLYSKNDATVIVGKTYEFWLYVGDLLADPEKYEIRINMYYDGRYELDADFLDRQFRARTAALNSSGLISEAEAIETARAYAAELELPRADMGKYVPSDRFGENTVLMIYSIENACIAYKVSDPAANHFSIDDGFGGTHFAVWANVYVDAKTGAILENRYNQSVSIA